MGDGSWVMGGGVTEGQGDGKNVPRHPDTVSAANHHPITQHHERSE
jgi:hypothetical protein